MRISDWSSDVCSSDLLDTAALSLHLAPGARLRHARIHDAADGATRFLRTDAVLAEDAEYRSLDPELGAALSRHELNARLEGDRTRWVANGVLLAAGQIGIAAGRERVCK